MIGDDVQDVSHTVLAQRGHELFEIFCAADLGIQQVVIDDVVTMRAPRAGSKIRRGITVSDSQGGQIRNQSGRIGEGEVAVELQTIRGQRNLRRAHG